MKDCFALTGNESATLRQTYWDKRKEALAAGDRSAAAAWDAAADLLSKARDAAYARRCSKRTARRNKEVAARIKALSPHFA